MRMHIGWRALLVLVLFSHGFMVFGCDMDPGTFDLQSTDHEAACLSGCPPDDAFHYALGSQAGLLLKIPADRDEAKVRFQSSAPEVFAIPDAMGLIQGSAVGVGTADLVVTEQTRDGPREILRQTVRVDEPDGVVIYEDVYVIASQGGCLPPSPSAWDEMVWDGSVLVPVSSKPVIAVGLTKDDALLGSRDNVQVKASKQDVPWKPLGGYGLFRTGSKSGHGWFGGVASEDVVQDLKVSSNNQVVTTLVFEAAPLSRELETLEILSSRDPAESRWAGGYLVPEARNASGRRFAAVTGTWSYAGQAPFESRVFVYRYHPDQELVVTLQVGDIVKTHTVKGTWTGEIW